MNDKIIFTMNPEEAKKMRRICKEDDRSISSFIRTACRDKMNRIKKETMEEIHS